MYANIFSCPIITRKTLFGIYCTVTIMHCDIVIMIMLMCMPKPQWFCRLGLSSCTHTENLRAPPEYIYISPPKRKCRIQTSRETLDARALGSGVFCFFHHRSKYSAAINPEVPKTQGVCIHWTGQLDWTTGLTVCHNKKKQLYIYN